MKLYFRPMPGLTIVTAIALAILISLGTWQYQRLQWKTDLLAGIDQVADAPPFTSIHEVKDALERDEPIDFRRIDVSADSLADETPFFVFTASNRDISWRVFRSFRTNSTVFMAAQETVSDTARNNVADTVAQTDRLVGYVRLARKVRGAAKSTPEKNRWFGFNPMSDSHDWANDLPRDADMRFYIDTVPGAMSAEKLPARRPEIRNNHFDYMLTWYGLAVVLLVIYLILHRRAGRLGRT